MACRPAPFSPDGTLHAPPPPYDTLRMVPARYLTLLPLLAGESSVGVQPTVHQPLSLLTRWRGSLFSIRKKNKEMTSLGSITTLSIRCSLRHNSYKRPLNSKHRHTTLGQRHNRSRNILPIHQDFRCSAPEKRVRCAAPSWPMYTHTRQCISRPSTALEGTIDISGGEKHRVRSTAPQRGPRSYVVSIRRNQHS